MTLPRRANPPKLLYVRHGETLWSLSRRHTGVTGIPLTPHGEAQARALKTWFDHLSLAHVWIARLRALGEDGALFSHGQFGAASAARWMGSPALEAKHLALGPASVSVLSYDPDQAESPVVALWNVAPACNCLEPAKQISRRRTPP